MVAHWVPAPVLGLPKRSSQQIVANPPTPLLETPGAATGPARAPHTPPDHRTEQPLQPAGDKDRGVGGRGVALRWGVRAATIR